MAGLGAFMPVAGHRHQKQQIVPLPNLSDRNFARHVFTGLHDRKNSIIYVFEHLFIFEYQNR